MLKDSEFLNEGGVVQVQPPATKSKGDTAAHMLIYHGQQARPEDSKPKLPPGLAEVLTESDLIDAGLEDLEALKPAVDPTSSILGANVSFLDQIPGKYQSAGGDHGMADEEGSVVQKEYPTEDKPSSPYSSVNGTTTISNLRKYVETSPNEVNWLMNDSGEAGGKGAVNRDTSFEQEVITCRQKFLADSISEHILDELIAEVKADPLYFKPSPAPQPPALLGDGRVTLNLLEDPRYISESSEEETVYGIRTNMNAVFEYCNLLVRFISDHYLDLLLDKYNTKIGQRPDKMLGEIRTREIGLLNSMTPWASQLGGGGKFSLPSNKAEDTFLPEFIFNRLEEEIINLFDMQRVYHKSIFDCLNEILVGKWKADQDIDYFKVIVNGKQHISRGAATVQDMEGILNSAKDTVVEFSTMMCGLIKDKEDSLIGNIRMMNLEKIELIREERLFRFLCFEAVEMEKKFTNYTMDEVYSLIDCSEAVFETLVEEVIFELLEIRDKP